MHITTAQANTLIPPSLPACFYTLRPMPAWHPEPVSNYIPIRSEYIPPGAALQHRPVSYTHLDVYKRQLPLPWHLVVAAANGHTVVAQGQNFVFRDPGLDVGTAG